MVLLQLLKKNVVSMIAKRIQDDMYYTNQANEEANMLTKILIGETNYNSENNENDNPSNNEGTIMDEKNRKHVHIMDQKDNKQVIQEEGGGLNQTHQTHQTPMFTPPPPPCSELMNVPSRLLTLRKAAVQALETFNHHEGVRKHEQENHLELS
eukprot:CAMPEP_0114343512 /NCGR_PEP_ID=MMETSP0101-20121206/10660_1 /TAXON_ID=38822 ORGANISM="Pteridomonas danica, Strain PT" /NCGR_SAMPLE_ID=MMETSP0101 /ASSEMBLY_ACC=CAM_ASM_000211 /LENGTH=152 /DNA_ID=CAMNT_0001478267 /DNA_START=617 /DNA_END=1072 /DNA_ORIENTATION=+